MGGDDWLIQECVILCDEDPGSAEFAGLLVSGARNQFGLHAFRLSHERDGRAEIHMLIGDVEGDDAAGREVAAIERQRLGGEQMKRDGVAGERIDDEHIKVLRGLMLERGAGVARDHVHLGAGFADVGEDVASDGLDGGVDFVVADVVAGLAVGGDRSGAKADDADVARAEGTVGAKAAEAQGVADAGIGRVVGGGSVAQFIGAEDLGSMLDGAVEQGANSGSGVAERSCLTRSAA